MIYFNLEVVFRIKIYFLLKHKIYKMILSWIFYNTVNILIGDFENNILIQTYILLFYIIRKELTIYLVHIEETSMNLDFSFFVPRNL